MDKKARKDMSMGMKDYDKGYAKAMNEKHGNPASGKTLGHASAPMKLNMMPKSMEKGGKCPNRGYDAKAYDYKY